MESMRVVTLGGDGELRLLAVDGTRSTGRRLVNAVRGAVFRSIDSTARAVLDRSTPVSGDAGTGYPVLHPTVGTALAAVVASGDRATPEALREYASRLALWVWSNPVGGGPPRLHLSTSAMDLLGVAEDHRDRVVHGPADFFTRVPALGDAVRHLDWLTAADQERQLAVGRSAGSDRTDRVTRVADLGVVGDDGGRATVEAIEARLPSGDVLGMGWARPELAYPSNLADAICADSNARAAHVHIAIMDLRFPAAPYVLRWLGGPPEGIGHGFSTGQNNGIHPDDRDAVTSAIVEAATRPPTSPVPVSARVRALTGGWMEVIAKAWFVDHRTAPGIVAVSIDCGSGPAV
ncbi:hypothetical protein SAMN04489765_3812 [Tsukamurella pulmonis]|uniref:Uncharacterized protein n=1 Tax=Tsukamurella pulmonis TaxID=47312 RepID=A0A1H1H4S7_9ACTN|nr:hypothetical protein SAMN04489765_3812 [Tsukamurella pulmonis]SUP15963.1 Uncharacterised protein [Tsukamurella pulmonis]